MADGATDWTGLMGLIGAAAIGTGGALYNNYVNKKLQQSINADVINLANTAHQREVADLRAAGLNPILSATGNGAPVPSLGTPHQDNVLSDFGSNARAIGQAVSRQRALENEAYKLDNESTRIANRVADSLSEMQIHSGLSQLDAENEQAKYATMLNADKYTVLENWRGGYYSKDGKFVPINPDYLKEVKDSVKAEVKEPGTRYLQSWINSGKGVADTVVNAAGRVIQARKPVRGRFSKFTP